jgi:Skp family chaperone for outer membrane proteins
VTRWTPTDTRAALVAVGLALLGAASAGAQAAAPAPAALAPLPTTPLRIVYINGRDILQQTPGYATAESTFNHEVEGYRAEVQRLNAQLDSAARAFEMEAVALSPAQKTAKQKELQTMQQHLQDRQNELQQKAQARESELLQPIQARVNAVLQGMRAEGNYSFILDAESPGSPLVAADPTLDITTQVLARLHHSQ